jgi:polar amino acid transport system substrate-binding protein
VPSSVRISRPHPPAVSVLRLPLPLALLCALLAGCGSSTSSSSSSSASAANCNPGSLKTVSNGVLTVATDKPAYPPYFENDDPTNGKGFESAVAYAIGDRLGFKPADVHWTVEPFNASYAPGPKKFDFDVNEISITPARSKEVDFSAPYYTANQAVVALPGTEAAKATSLADLKSSTIGVQIGSTSLDAVNALIQPDSQPKVFQTSNDVVSALKTNQVDAVVVDLPTALYLTAAQVPNAEIAGQFSAPGGDTWGALLGKGSPLTSCVSKAVDELRSSGELQKITQRWMSKAASAPLLH